MKFGLTADSSSCSAGKFVFHRIQVFPSLKAAAPSFESLNCRRPLCLPLSPSPVSSAPIKTRMESIRWLAPIVLLPKGRGLCRRGPSRNLAVWASTSPLLRSRPPPISWGCCYWRLEAGHGSARRAMPQLAAPCGPEAEFVSLLGECHPPASGETEGKGKDGLGS